MTAYYNENDPNAAAWLRELIREGLIAEGEVDERDIRDIRPADLAGFVQCHFFAGIGGWSYALRLAGWPDDKPVWTGSCPCQPFSAAGKGEGFADERHLWPYWFWLISQCEPAIIFGEQVANKSAEPWLDLVQDDLEALGYAFGAVPLPAASVGAPHIRDRFWFVAESNRIARGQGRELDRGRDPGSDAESRTGLGGCECADELAESGDERREGQRLLLRERGPLAAVSEAGRRGEAGELAGSSRSRLEIVGEQPAREELKTVERGGATRGFWHPADWLPCRDGKARPVEPVLEQMADGLPASLGPVCASAVQKITEEILNATASEDDARKAVFALWKAIGPKALEVGNAGRFHGIQQATVLFAFLLQLADQGWPLAQGLSRSGKKATWRELRSLRSDEAITCPSCRRGLDEQRPEECANSVHLLSSILARHAQAAWGEAFNQNAAATFPLTRNAISRVGRLRAYGNAIVPQVAAEFIIATGL